MSYCRDASGICQTKHQKKLNPQTSLRCKKLGLRVPILIPKHMTLKPRREVGYNNIVCQLSLLGSETLLGQGHLGGSLVPRRAFHPNLGGCSSLYLHNSLSQLCESVQSIPSGFPSGRFLKLIPFTSKAFFMASRVLIIGFLRPFSKSLTVESETLATSASSSCDQSSQALAALHCSGFI